uniref:Uncharacterized protein n=1 Tax=Arundo donax TaxID=35708 RepID=A0A0A9AL55_ARUDO
MPPGCSANRYHAGSNVLAAWEQAVDLCCGDSEAKVLMIHTGGTLASLVWCNGIRHSSPQTYNVKQGNINANAQMCSVCWGKVQSLLIGPKAAKNRSNKS